MFVNGEGGARKAVSSNFLRANESLFYLLKAALLAALILLSYTQVTFVTQAFSATFMDIRGPLL